MTRVHWEEWKACKDGCGVERGRACRDENDEVTAKPCPSRTRRQRRPSRDPQPPPRPDPFVAAALKGLDDHVLIMSAAMKSLNEHIRLMASLTKALQRTKKEG